jgi:hypothetical protein
MTVETDKLIDQYLIDNKINFKYEIGDEYKWNGQLYTYGEHIIPIMDIVEQYPHCMYANNCIAIVKGETPKPTQTIKESHRQSLAQQILANPAALAQAANILSQIPGIDKAIESVKGAIKKVADQVPGKSGPASDIVNKVNQVNALMKSAVASPAGAIFSQVASQLMQGIPEGGTGNPPSNSNSLQQELQKLMADVNNPTAYAAQFSKMSAMFPQVDINKLVAMAANAVKNKNPQALMASMPQLLALGGGLMKMLGAQSKHPEKLPKKEKKTPKAEDPKKLVEPKNLFAPSAAASGMATLNGTVGSLIGIAATVVSNMNQIAPSPQKTSAGDQKLTATANTVYHGSGQHQPITQDDNAVKMLELSHDIETLQAEISDMVDVEKITTRTEADLRSIYPALDETTTVVELLTAIEEWETKTA